MENDRLAVATRALSRTMTELLNLFEKESDFVVDSISLCDNEDGRKIIVETKRKK